ncbi:hypothetical protein R2Q81_06875 [Microbacterium aquimaris]|uniref:hypothetical protein n=1 Tax=Microbacterium aquimaris TaxID=459816 RepID=UPI002AD2F495|nr:hypothetical protein [Microbacterium aquimaris]MDZ8275674.1 hypothetical protein [Microbacterium aquimaris]
MSQDRIDVGIITGALQRALCGEEFVPKVTVGSSGRADVRGARSCPNCEAIIDKWKQMKKLKDELLDLLVRVKDDEIAAVDGLMSRHRIVQEPAEVSGR